MNLQPFRVQVGVRGEEHLTIAAGAGLWAPGSSTSLVVDLAAAGLWCPLYLGPHLGKIRAPLPPREVPGCASSFPPCYRPLPSSSSILRRHPHLSPSFPCTPQGDPASGRALANVAENEGSCLTLLNLLYRVLATCMFLRFGPGARGARGSFILRCRPVPHQA